jgi:cobalt-zinc-cadmium efflux system protein
MEHNHSHHGHEHHSLNHGRAFAIGIALNMAFIMVEVIFGIKANSLALLADAGHNFSDVLGVGFGLGRELALAMASNR